MKLKTTTKAIKAGSARLYQIGYCYLQTLLKAREPFGYTCGLYGWNYDAYDLGGGVTLTTGYRGMPGACLDYKKVREFEERARAIMNDWNTPTEKSMEQRNALFAEFCEWVKSL
jgi:hypothetical protein